MVNTIKLATFCLLLALTVAALGGPETAKDPTHVPAKWQDIVFNLYNGIFENVNCHLLVGETGKGIIIDPTDLLEGAPEKAMLDLESKQTTILKVEELLQLLKNGKLAFADPADNAVTDQATIKSMLTNVPLVDPATGKKKLVFDCFHNTGSYGPKIVEYLTKHKITLKYIVLTHGHIDHIAGVKYLKEKTGAALVMHAGDTLLGYPKDGYRIIGGLPKVDQMLKDGELLSLDGMVFQAIQVPGHSPGGLCLRTRLPNGTNIVYSGDTLIYHTLGRSNFRDDSGDGDLLLKSIREKLFTLPDNTIVYPAHPFFGHNSTTIGEEKANNPFFQPEITMYKTDK
ncbi:MAG: MBL fold metallo-hydrolase [Armatimonadota bacterium]